MKLRAALAFDNWIQFAVNPKLCYFWHILDNGRVNLVEIIWSQQLYYLPQGNGLN